MDNGLVKRLSGANRLMKASDPKGWVCVCVCVKGAQV